jgi:hypothetical protein
MEIPFGRMNWTYLSTKAYVALITTINILGCTITGDLISTKLLVVIRVLWLGNSFEEDYLKYWKNEVGINKMVSYYFWIQLAKDSA